MECFPLTFLFGILLLFFHYIFEYSLFARGLGTLCRSCIVKSLICAFVCLFAAANQGRTAQVCLLLKHKANHHIRNIEGRTALDIAVQKADADVVTLLRLAPLNEEIRENNMSGSSDDTFNAVVSEFSQMVYTHPERLRNKSELIGSSKK